MVASLFAQLSVIGSNASSDQLGSDKARPSPRSTRRRLMFTNKIFQGEAFYLDLRTSVGSRARGQLEDDLTTLGGRVEPFLSKEITHLITDRVDLLSASGSPLASPTVTSSKPSSSNKSSPAVFSRAQALLNRSKTKQEQNNNSANASDPITLAKQWGIRIITLQKVLNIVEREKSKCDPHRKLTASKQGSKGPVRIRKLEGAFIKVEDLSAQYRPTSKNFASFPVIDLYNPAIDHNQSPFVARKKKPDEPDVDALRAKGLTTANDLQKKGLKVKPDVPNAVLTPKAGATPKGVVKSKTSGYCESCDKTYDCLKEHIKSDMHVKFAQDRQNFLELDSVVLNLPTLEQLMKSLQVSVGSAIQVKNEPVASEVDVPMETPMDLGDGGISEGDKGLVTPIKVEKSSQSIEDDGQVANLDCDNQLASGKTTMAIALPKPTAPQIPSNVSSNDATLPYAGPTLVTSQTERDLNQTRESSQDEKDVTLPYEETSQSEKDRTLPYGEDQCQVSSQEDLVYNQLDISVTANHSLPLEKASPMDSRTLNVIGTTQVIKVENPMSSEGKISMQNNAERNVLKTEMNSSSQPSEVKPVISQDGSGDLKNIIGQIQPISPNDLRVSDEGMYQITENSMPGSVTDMKVMDRSALLHLGSQNQKSALLGTEITVNGSCYLSDASRSASSEESSSHSEVALLDEGFSGERIQMDVKNEETSVSISNLVATFEDISNDELDTMHRLTVPMPSESNEGTMHEPLSSRGEHFDVSPVKLLTQFPFNFTGNRSEASRDSVVTGTVPESAPASVRSNDDQTRESFSGFGIVSEYSINPAIKSVRGASQNAINSIATPESIMDSQPALVNGPMGLISRADGETCLPESSASEASLYPTSFSNILSNLSAGSLSFNKDISVSNLLVQENEIQAQPQFIPNPSEVNIGQMPTLNPPCQYEDSPMDCSQPSSDAVENSIAMNLMAKLQNQDLNSSDSGSESDGFFNGNQGPASFDLDPMDLVTNRNDIGIEDMLSRDSVVCDSRSTTNIVFPLDVNSHVAADSHSSVLPQLYEVHITQPNIEEGALPTSVAQPQTFTEQAEDCEDPPSLDYYPPEQPSESVEPSEEGGNVFSAFDSHQNRNSQISFADLAKKAQVLPTFQQSNIIFSTVGVASESSGEKKVYFGGDSGDSNRLFSNCPSLVAEGSNSRPWSPSCMLNLPTKTVDKSQNSTVELSKGPYISPAKVVSTKAKKDKSKPKKKSKKKEKESPAKENKKSHKKKTRDSSKRDTTLKTKEINPGNEVGTNSNISPVAMVTTPVDTRKVKKSKKKSREPKEEKPKKSKKKESKSKLTVPASPVPSMACAPMFQTPKATVYSSTSSSNNSLDSGSSVWVATPSRGLKMRLCRVMVTPLGPKAADEDTDQEIDVEGLDEKPKRSKSRKSEKSKKTERTNRRRKLEYNTQTDI